LLLAEDNDKETAWHLAAEIDHVRTLQKLWELAEKEKLNTKNDLLLAKD